MRYGIGWVALVALLAAPPAFAVSNSPFGCPPSETVTTDPSENPDPATDDADEIAKTRIYSEIAETHL